MLGADGWLCVGDPLLRRDTEAGGVDTLGFPSVAIVRPLPRRRNDVVDEGADGEWWLC